MRLSSTRATSSARRRSPIVAKHARASQAEVRLLAVEGRLRLETSDDGRGGEPILAAADCSGLGTDRGARRTAGRRECSRSWDAGSPSRSRFPSGRARRTSSIRSLSPWLRPPQRATGDAHPRRRRSGARGQARWPRRPCAVGGQRRSVCRHDQGCRARDARFAWSPSRRPCRSRSRTLAILAKPACACWLAPIFLLARRSACTRATATIAAAFAFRCSRTWRCVFRGQASRSHGTRRGDGRFHTLSCARRHRAHAVRDPSYDLNCGR